MANTNLDSYKRVNNSDWNTWIKLVKKVYKANGHILTQQQALIVAKDSYPGKGNVIGRNEDLLAETIPVKGDEIPPNPVRRPKKPAPKKEPETHYRDEPKGRDPNSRRRRYVEYEDDTPPRSRRREYEEGPPRSRDYEEPKRRRRPTEEDYSSDEAPPRRSSAPRRKNTTRSEYY